jgi:FtsZ-binding cell division protein ZapB
VSTIEEVTSLKDKLTSLENELSASDEKAKSDMLALKSENERLQMECDSLKSNEASTIEEVTSLKNKLTSLENELAASDEKAKSDMLVLKSENERLQMECDSLKSNEVSTSEQVTSLKDKLASLEKEYEALKEEEPDKFESNVLPSPAACLTVQDENLSNNTFMDDSFDEDMFLPNMGSPAKEAAPLQSPQPSEEANHCDENKPSETTPSKTPFKERRALFSPKKTPSIDTAAANTTAKKPIKKAGASRSSKTPAETSPIKRVTRRSTRNLRTPLGTRNE